MALLSQSAYAKHAGLSAARVCALVQEGLPTVDGKIDPEVADAWIEQNLDPLKRMAGKSTTRCSSGVAAARRKKIEADTSLVRLKLREHQSSFVDKSEVENFVRRQAAKTHETWPAWIMKTAPAMASEFNITPQAARAFLERAVREHIDEMGEPAPMDLPN